MFLSLKTPRHIHGSHLRVTRKQWRIRSLFLLVLALLLGNGLLNRLRKRSDVALKVIPNDFDALGLSIDFVQEHMRRPIPLVNADEFRNGPYRYQRGLGAGREGSVDLYTHRDTGENVVVKRYGEGPEISWSRVPILLNQSTDTLPQHWPSEISSALAIEAICNVESNCDQFVPLRTVFFGALDHCHESPAWHLVMPMMSGGSVGKLAKHLRSDHASDVHDLDMQFRPAFEGLLGSLASLHTKGLCHDDVKEGNVLLHHNITQWSLSDYGQVRGVAHPYHTTRMWIEAQQWTKCKLNDVRRALKLYIGFLRNACEDSEQFDAEFYAGKTPWSRLYWEYFQSPISAQFLIDLSRSHMPGFVPANPGPSGEPPGLVPLRLFARPSTVRRLAVDWELKTMLLGLQQCTWSSLALFGWDIETLAA